MLLAAISLAVVASHGSRPVSAPPRESRVKISLPAARIRSTPRAEGPVQRRARFSDSKNRVVASSMLAPGVRFVRVRRQSPPQQIVVTVVRPHARIRAVHVQAGPDWAPFDTVSSAVKRTHALAGINGMPTGFNGQPMLVREGRIVPSSHGGPLEERHPRTGVGLTQDGSALFVTVDGRRATAVGMTLREFAIFMRSLGAVWAVNLDGGASSTMVVRGKVANSPSDPYGERSVPYAVVLLTSGRLGMFHLLAQLREFDDRIAPATSWFRRTSQEDIYGFRRPA
jgi:Phosphodiester glycosidase